MELMCVSVSASNSSSVYGGLRQYMVGSIVRGYGEAV